jgi:stage II sporulation protein D
LDEWLSLYEKIMTDFGTVEITNLNIVSVPAVSDSLKQWQVETDKGIFNAEGVPLEDAVGQTVSAYVRETQLLMAVNATETVPVIEHIDTAETEAAIDAEDIRVCLMTTGFTSEYHDKVTLMCDTAWTISFDNEIRKCLPGETVTLTAENFTENNDKATIYSDEEGMIQVLSIERDCGYPSYEGTLTIYNTTNGLQIVNTLSLEHYLYGVVPGEMPANYAVEALKAQAVCARSYAVLAMQSPKYAVADVNDSTACQVYMNQNRDERCQLAVDATTGQVLTYQGQVVSGRYFSTSCGSLSDSKDIWLYPEELEELSHIQAALETIPSQTPSLSDETAFRQFIDSPPTDTYIEENEAWFRWQTQISLEDISDAMRRCLKQRMSVNPKHFTLISENGEVDFSDVSKVEIIERADSGVVKKIKITGQSQELTVSGEYNIRCLLSGGSDWTVTLRDNTQKSGLSLLPSGYFYLVETINENTVTGYEIYGGGLGHGAGMSQNGARILAEKGYDYTEILNYYFNQ